MFENVKKSRGTTKFKICKRAHGFWKLNYSFLFSLNLFVFYYVYFYKFYKHNNNS